MNPAVIAVAVALPAVVGYVLGVVVGRTRAVKESDAYRRGHDDATARNKRAIAALHADLVRTEQRVITNANQHRLSEGEQIAGGASWN